MLKKNAEIINDARKTLRQNGMYEESDKIRQALESENVYIKDYPDGDTKVINAFDRMRENYIQERKQNYKLLDEVAYYKSRYETLYNYFKGNLISTPEREWIENIRR